MNKTTAETLALVKKALLMKMPLSRLLARRKRIPIIALPKQGLGTRLTDRQANRIANRRARRRVGVICGPLSGYDLQAPAKNIYPTITPLRNRISPAMRAALGDAVWGRPTDSLAGLPE